MEQDWRLNRQEEYLQNAVLYRVVFPIFWEKAMTNTECEFYCTKDMYHWICKECFEDFKDKFGWTVKSADKLFD